MPASLPGPHQGQPVARAGKPLAQARAAMILVHGRGATAQSILELRAALAHPDVAYLAPQAFGNSWYPFSFLAPIAQNEPWLTSALQALADLTAHVEAAGLPAEKIVLGGFSQGACLVSEFAARNAQRYGGVLVFSGGLIGPPGTPRDYPGALNGTPVFIGCSDADPHIPLERVRETADVLTQMAARVTTKIYPGLGHTLIQDEIEQAREVLQAAVSA